MSGDKFSYKDAVKYIGNKWVAELWQQKYTIMSTVLFAYVSSASGENNDNHEEMAKQIFANPLAFGLVRCSNDLYECQRDLNKYSKFIDGQQDTIREQETLIKFMNEGLRSLCNIVLSVSASNNTYTKFCDLVNNGAIDLLGTQYEQIDFMHDEL